MTPAEEDALIDSIGFDVRPMILEDIRKAIRAAYAQGREDAAKVCDSEMLGNPFGDWGMGHDAGLKIAAAAIRRGE